MLPPKIGAGVEGSRLGGVKGFFSSFLSSDFFSLVAPSAATRTLYIWTPHAKAIEPQAAESPTNYFAEEHGSPWKSGVPKVCCACFASHVPHLRRSCTLVKAGTFVCPTKAFAGCLV